MKAFLLALLCAQRHLMAYWGCEPLRQATYRPLFVDTRVE
jgi:hypothetical protein